MSDLGYITWGNIYHTFREGGQRVKFGYRVKDTGKTFYILDEPTTGLHFGDI